MADEGERQLQLILQSREQIENLRLARHVEAGDDFVGEHEARRQRDGARDADALALPAGEFMRIALREGGGQADGAERRRGALARVAGRLPRRGETAAARR